MVLSMVFLSSNPLEDSITLSLILSHYESPIFPSPSHESILIVLSLLPETSSMHLYTHIYIFLPLQWELPSHDVIHL